MHEKKQQTGVKVQYLAAKRRLQPEMQLLFGI